MIVLASASPRRKKLMKSISSDFLTFDTNIDESLSYQLLNPYEVVKDIAKRKGIKAHEVYPNDLVIACDTIVVLDNEIIHKPIDENDANKILHHLSDKRHEVLTSYIIIHHDKIIQECVSSFVTFNELSDELIFNYIKSGSPLDKAGAYGIQDNDKYPLIKKLEGSYDNVVGFPTKEIKESLEKITQ